MSVTPPVKPTPTKATMLTPTHSVTKAIVRVIHKAVTAVLKKVAPNAPIRKYGIHPLAWPLFLKAGIASSRIGQTIGGAPASAGTHLKDGEYQGHDYTVCTDLHISDLSHAEAFALADKLAAVGLCPFVRIPGVNGWTPADRGGVYHLHAVFAGATMKAICLRQVRDYLAQPAMLNGLKSHESYAGWTPPHDGKVIARRLFLALYPHALGEG